MSDLRIGLGVDAHALEPGVPLVLGGVSFRGTRGLAGHSDGDVVAHALIDALLGPAGLGDIGTLFPAEDPELKGVSSLKLLREAYAQVVKCGFRLVNADVMLIGEEPRIGQVRRQMQLSLAGAIGVDPDRITVRATTTDRLGFTGRGEGLAAQAVALLERPAPGA
jgi:2-C-methyl-D-erythritol 2,4-cyclodiphosphate synthase